jgi:hypothetical protein
MFALSAGAAYVLVARSWIEARLFWCNGPSVGFICPGPGFLDRRFGSPTAVVVILGLVSLLIGAFGGVALSGVIARARLRATSRWKTVTLGALLGTMAGPTGLVAACALAGPPQMKDHGPIETMSYWPMQALEILQGNRDLSLTSHAPPSDDGTLSLCMAVGGIAGAFYTSSRTRRPIVSDREIGRAVEPAVAADGARPRR